MPLSALTALSDITQNAPARPAVFNDRFAIIQRNFDELNSAAGVSASSLAGWDAGSISTTLNTSGGTLSVLTINAVSGASVVVNAAVSTNTLGPTSGNTITVLSSASLTGQASAGTWLGLWSGNTMTPQSGNTTQASSLSLTGQGSAGTWIGVWSGNTATPESGNTVRVLNGKALVARSYDSGGFVFNVLGYGADPTGATDSTVACAAAVTAAVAVQGTVQFSQGTFLLSALTFSGNSITIEGAGMQRTVLKLADGTNSSLVRNTPEVQAITLRNLSINGSSSSNSQDPGGGLEGVAINNAQRVLVEGVEVYHTHTDGIQYRNVTDGVVRECLLRSNGSTGVNASGIALIGQSGDTGCFKLQVLGNKVLANTGTGNGIFVASFTGTSNYSHIIIANNIIEGSADEGIEIKGCTHFTVANNIIRDTTNDAILVRASSYGVVSGNEGELGMQGVTLWVGTDADNGPVRNVTVVGNTMSHFSTNPSDGAGIRLLANTSSLQTIENIAITGNTIYAISRQGIFLTDNGTAAVRGVVIDGNTCSGNSNTGILVDGAVDVVISGNVCNDNQHPSDGGFSAGIRIINAARDIVVNNNRCSGNDHGIRTENSANSLTFVGNVLTGNTTSFSTANTSATITRISSNLS